MRGIGEAIAEASKPGFLSADKGIKSSFFCSLEIALVELIHQETLDSEMAESFGRILQSNALVGALAEKIGAQYLHSLVISIKGMSSNKIENVENQEKHLVVNLSASDTRSSSKVLDADSAIKNKHKNRTSRKTAKRRSRGKVQILKKYKQSSSSSSKLDAETDNSSPYSCKESSKSKLEGDRRHCSKKHFCNSLGVIRTVNIRFSRVIN